MGGGGGGVERGVVLGSDNDLGDIENPRQVSYGQTVKSMLRNMKLVNGQQTSPKQF